MLSEFKGEFQHRFQSKCHGYIFQNSPPKKNPEVIPFTLIREKHQFWWWALAGLIWMPSSSSRDLFVALPTCKAPAPTFICC